MMRLNGGRPMSFDEMQGMQQNIGNGFNGAAQGQAMQPQTPYTIQNPNALVNPYYMRQQATDSIAPMQMYQQFRQTGQMPAPQQNQFQHSNARMNGQTGAVRGIGSGLAAGAQGGK